MRVTIKCNKDEKVANYREDNKRCGRHRFDHYQCCTSWWNMYISHVSIQDFKATAYFEFALPLTSTNLLRSVFLTT